MATVFFDNVCKVYSRGDTPAVDGFSLDVSDGEFVVLVGPSGCGKSTIGRLTLRLIEATEGEIIFEGKDIRKFSHDEMQAARKKMQIVFQDPYASLNPRMSVRNIVAEPLKIHGLDAGRQETDKKVIELLQKVGLDSYHAVRYPHEFSGGQRQRIGIARAIAINPKLIIADEPVSALDVSIQSQVLNLMNQLKREMGLTYIFVAHDLSVVEHISDRVGVMYLGNFVEIADKESLYVNPLHPYTQALLSAVPIPDPTIKRERIILQGNIPSPLNAPKGCKFHTRCPKCMDICAEIPPEKKQVDKTHCVYCHLYD